ncbi:MAG: acyltransferase family protein [Alphaproteobacteria bacterium]|nr:acyltransferase family protein [Alphaproteobacteria bacterium]
MAIAANTDGRHAGPKERPAGARKARTLAEAWNASREGGRARARNNFDAIRLVAAVAVVLSHSFEIVAGDRSTEPLFRLTGQISLGELAVLVFFAASGFLIADSWRRRPDLADFAARRAARIFPALWINVAALAFIIGPMVSRLDAGVYFADPQVARFLPAALLVNIGWTLPGVFETAPIAGAVNYPLWSLAFEAMGYGLIAALGAMRRMSPASLGVAFAALMALHLSPPGEGADAMAVLAYRMSLVLPTFCAGAIAACVAPAIKMTWRRAFLALGALALTGAVGGMVAAFSIAGTYLVLFVATVDLGPVAAAGRRGDFSYGIYLWGWPAQQFVQTILAPAHWAANFALAAPIVGALAYLSWRFVERPALISIRHKAPPRENREPSTP